jgi:hypothetical protein
MLEEGILSNATDDWYDMSDPWPTTPDGTGQALERVTDGNYGNDVANWTAATPSPGS